MNRIQQRHRRKSIVRENPSIMAISCKTIIKLDDSIRFVGIASEKGQLVAIEYQKDLDLILSTAETEWLTLLSVVRKESRIKFQNKLGKFNYSIGTYDKVKRATIYLEEGFILLVSFEVNRDSDKIILKILQLLSKYMPHHNSSFIESMIAIAEEKIKQEKFAAIGVLTSRIAHDLRNPLSAIKNVVEIMEIEFENKQDENTKENLEMLKRGISRLSHDIDDVLDFVKDTPIKLEKTSLSNVINSVISRIHLNSINIKLPKNDIEIVCDHSRLEIAFMNILQNAIEAIKDNGKIEIRIIEYPSEIIIEFEDNGDDIPEDILAKIFEPLFTTKQTGTGLGLMTTRNIIEQHGGTISAKNNPVTFTIKLPKHID